MERKTIKDAFGEIELEKIGQTSMYMAGEDRIDTIYTDKRGNFWIETMTTFSGDGLKAEPMVMLRKGLVDLIGELTQNK
jgi:hypothetical protein